LPRPYGPGIQVIEIAARDAAPWATYLIALGFRRGAKISSRTRGSGSIFERDAARILISEVAAEDTRTPAAEHVSRHGDGVALVTLRVPDVLRAWIRATGAGAEALSGWRHAVTNDGLAMVEDALLGAAGVNYLLFASPGQTPGSRREAAIDHIVLAVDGADLGSAAWLHSRAFGLEFLAAQKIRMENETLRSVMLGGDGWGLVIAAQEPPGSAGLMSAFLHANSGPGIRHVAFRVPDIVATVSTAAARGAGFLPIPDAHYDSAARRLGYQPANLDELRRGRIALGRDTDGRMVYQATTGPVSPESQVSFGLVQRPAGTLEPSSEVAAAIVAAQAAREATAITDSAGEVVTAGEGRGAGGQPRVRLPGPPGPGPGVEFAWSAQGIERFLGSSAIWSGPLYCRHERFDVRRAGRSADVAVLPIFGVDVPIAFGSASPVREARFGRQRGRRPSRSRAPG
jgi:4-hydroxyphenylpyruvate dioxygenase